MAWAYLRRANANAGPRTGHDRREIALSLSGQIQTRASSAARKRLPQDLSLAPYGARIPGSRTDGSNGAGLCCHDLASSRHRWPFPKWARLRIGKMPWSSEELLDARPVRRRPPPRSGDVGGSNLVPIQLVDTTSIAGMESVRSRC